MPWNIKAAPDTWHVHDAHHYGSGYYVTYDEGEMEEFRQATEDDKKDCSICLMPEEFKPDHNTGYIWPDGLRAATYHCPSLSRWFNPKTRQMEGHSHCSCARCF